MTNELALLWLSAFPLMGSPGPATMSLAAIGTAFGLRPALTYLLGIIAGTTAVLMMIATGITAIILAQPALLTALTVIAGLYILYLAWKIATAPVGSRAASARNAPAFIPGFALAIANPKAFAAIGAVYAGHTLFSGDLMLDTLAKLGALTAVIIIVNTAWLTFGATFSAILTNPVAGRTANFLFAAMLVGSVGLALLAA